MTSARQDFVEAQQRMLDRYGVAADSRFLDVPSVTGQAQALVCGEGPPVLMLNGIGTPAAMWAPLMGALEGFRLIAVDLPGFGLTDTTPRIGEDPRGDAVRFLDEVLDGLGLDRTPIVANSQGALWASWLALEQPSRVSALVFLGCPALALDSSAPLPMRVLSVRPLGRLLTWLQPPSPEQVEQLGRMVKEHPLVPELADLLVATERLPGFRETFLSTLHGLLRLRGSRPDVRLKVEQLEKIGQPTLLFWGRDEPFGTPDMGEQVAASMPSATLHVVGGGHCPWLTQSERIGPVAASFLHRHG
jgi:pimeloyl-ACP methyl ester carboxylesterase